MLMDFETERSAVKILSEDGGSFQSVFLPNNPDNSTYIATLHFRQCSNVRLIYIFSSEYSDSYKYGVHQMLRFH